MALGELRCRTSLQGERETDRPTATATRCLDSHILRNLFNNSIRFDSIRFWPYIQLVYLCFEMLNTTGQMIWVSAKVWIDVEVLKKVPNFNLRFTDGIFAEKKVFKVIQQVISLISWVFIYYLFSFSIN